ncbi:hypothetical protein F5888DRAFT_1123729 [Russula emetica]|nr:hypothetical protein F5888DRAFT_1123729 [Russula emetica]
MFHLVFSLTSRFLYLRNILQGFARGILALRSLDTISSYLAPALSPPPPVPLLDAPAPFVDHPEQIILPYPSRDVIAIERQLPVFASPFPIYQSSLIAVTPSQFPKFLPLLVILAVISGFVVVLPEITYSLMNIAKSFKSKSTFYRLPTSLPSQFASFNLPISLISLSLLCTGPPVIATFFAFVWFMSILFSYEQVSNMIVAILQWCGLLIVQDTRTPPLLDAIYEQITRGAAGYSDLLPSSDLSDEHNKYQVITDYSLGYSHLAAQLSAHDLGLQSAPMRREDQEPEVSVQRIQTESVNSQNLHRQPELSHAREQKLDADLLASEQERERLIALASALESSRKDKQAWKKIAVISKSFYAEAEMTASNLRTDLEVATGRVRNVQEQLDHQIELVSGKDSIIQSITKESQLAHTRFRLERDRRVRETKELLHEKVMAQHRYEAATDRVRNLQEQLDHQIELASGKDSTIQSITKESRLANTRLRLERDRQVREMKEFLHEKGMIRRRYESEMRRLTQEAQDAQEQLDALRHTLSQLRSDRQPSLDRDQPLRNQPLTTWPFDTGRPPLPPEWNLDTGTSPVSPAIDPDSSHGSTKSTPRSPIQDPMDSSKRLAARLLEIPGVCDQESEVAKEQRAALVELIERMRQVEPESAVDVKPNERDETHLQEELIATKEQLRLAEEDVRDLRRELGQSRESLHDAETRVRALENELDICQATVREAQDARYASEIKFTEATQLLRLRQAESESSMARAEESEFKCSQVIFLCAALRERVTELEAKVKKSKSVRKYRAHSNSRSRRPTDACTDLGAVAHDPGIREFDSIYMTVPPSMPRLIDECPPIPLASADSGSCYPTDPDPESNTHDTHAQTFDSIVLTAPPSLPSSPRLLDVSLPQSSSGTSHQMRPAIPPTCTDSHSFSPEDMDLDFSTPNANSQILDSPLSSHASTSECLCDFRRMDR